MSSQGERETRPGMSSQGERTVIPAAVDQALDDHFDHYLALFREHVRHPSVSSTGEGITEYSAFLQQSLAGDFGLSVNRWESAGNPVLRAEADAPGSQQTLVVYGHYDVQPVDESQWQYPPFGADLVDGKVYGRGSVDDKGNFFAALMAIDAFRRAGQPLPVKVIVLLEGEEEIGSPNFGPVLAEHTAELNGNALVFVDGTAYAHGRAELVYGLKGMLSLTLSVRTAEHDVHSGKAPVLDNAAWRLVAVLAQLKGPGGTIRIRGFKTGAVQPGQADLEAIRRNGLTRQDLIDTTGVSSYHDLPPEELFRRLYFEPTLNISSLRSGYLGPGQKSTIPATASCDLDIRLVPGQDPQDILERLQQYLRDQGFGDVEVTVHGAFPAAKTPVTTPAFRSLEDSMTAVTGQRPVIKPINENSGPGHLFEAHLKMPQVLARLGPPGDLMHVPGEHMPVQYLRRGARIMADYLQRLSLDS